MKQNARGEGGLVRYLHGQGRVLYRRFWQLEVNLREVGLGHSTQASPRSERSADSDCEQLQWR